MTATETIQVTTRERDAESGLDYFGSEVLRKRLVNRSS